MLGHVRRYIQLIMESNCSCPKITLCKCSFLSVCCVVFFIITALSLKNVHLAMTGEFSLLWTRSNTFDLEICSLSDLISRTFCSEFWDVSLSSQGSPITMIYSERERETVSEHGLIKQHTRSPYEMRERKRHRARKRSEDWQGRWS